MGLTTFSDAGDLDWCAATEQMALNYGIYFEGVTWVRKTVEKAYGLAVTVVAERREPAAFFDGAQDDLPRYIAFTQLDDPRLHVVIMGTRAYYQWVQNFWSQGTNRITTGQCPLGHRSWNAIGDGLLAALQPWLQAHPTGEVNISGHSLGGVSAWILGVKIRNQLQHAGVKVNVMTFGSPRQSIGPFAGGICPAPHFVANIQTLEDIVVVLPTNVVSVGPQWMQNGPIHVIKRDGSEAASDANATFNYLPLNEERFSNHYPGTYQNALLRKYDEELICAGGTLPLLIAANLKEAQPPIVPVLPSPPPSIDGYSPDETLAAAQPSFHIGGPVALQKVTLFANWGGKRFSETYYRDGDFDPQPEGTDKAGAYSKTVLLIQARSGLLCKAKKTGANPLGGINTPSFVGYRQSEVEAPFKSLPYVTPAAVSEINSNREGDRDQVIYLRAITTSNSRRTISLKAIPDDWVASDPSQKVHPPAPSLQAVLLPFVTRLLADGWGALVQTLSNQRAITSITTLAAAIPEAPAGSWVLKAAGSYVPNQRIYVKGARGMGLRGFGGKYRVVAIQSDGSLVLNETKCDPCPLKITSLGSIWDRALSLSTFKSVTFAGSGTRILGNGNFFSEAGRRPACCRP